MSQRKRERGQVIILVLLAMSLFLIAAAGLAIDGSNLYAHRQMAQATADSAAQAAMMSIFDHTNTSGAAPFDPANGAFDCGINNARTPCKYAGYNSFGSTSADTIHVEFPPASQAPAGVILASDPYPLVRVTVTRNVNTTLMRMLGPTATSVKAVAMAAITSVVSPIPIVITHPNLAGALSMNGNTQIKICGGPTRSIQVNSKNAGAVDAASIDLSHAGPLDNGTCTLGTGADFGVFGGSATAPGSIAFGTTGHYIQPASPIEDPLASVPAPAAPGAAPADVHVNNGQFGCTNSSGCQLYSPGLYSGGLGLKNTDVVFKPGLYYVQGGDFSLKHTTAVMCPPASCVPSLANPEIGNGMVVYHTGSGSFQIDTNVTASFLGAPVASSWKGILFFQDRNAPKTSHGLGQGNGCFDLIGTVYITNTLAIMNANPNQYQSVSYNGNPCTGTIKQGEIIVGQLSLVGTSDLDMWLNPTSFLNIRQVALVK